MASDFPLIPHELAVPITGPGWAASPILATAMMTMHFRKVDPILKHFPKEWQPTLERLGWLRCVWTKFNECIAQAAAALVAALAHD